MQGDAASPAQGGRTPDNGRPTPSRLPGPGLSLAVVYALLLVAAHWCVGIGLTSVASFYYVSLTQQLGDVDAFLDRFDLILSPIAALNLLLLALGVPWLNYRPETTRALGWRKLDVRHWGWVVLSVMPLVVLTAELRNRLTTLTTALGLDGLSTFANVDQRFVHLSLPKFAVAVLVSCVLTALREEVYCRGFLARGLIARQGLVVGTLVTSLLFGFMHLDLVQGINAFFLGVAFQFVCLVTRSLWAPIVLHLLNNLCVLTLVQYADFYSVPGLTPTPIGPPDVTPAWLLVSAAVTLVCLTVVMIQTRTRWILPDGSVWTPGYVSAELPPEQLGARPVSRRANPWLVVTCLASHCWLIVAAACSLNI